MKPEDVNLSGKRMTLCAINLLCRHLHHRTNVPLRYIRPIVVAMGAVIVERVAKGETVNVPDMGRFLPVQKGPYLAIRFRPSARCKRIVSGNPTDAVLRLKYPPFIPPETPRGYTD